MQMLTQVLKILPNLPMGPSVKEQLHDSLERHVLPMLKPKKSAGELIVEKQTERAQEASALSVKQNKHDQFVASAQNLANEIWVHSERLTSLENELLNLHAAELRLQEPQQPHPAPNGPAPVDVHMPAGAPADLPADFYMTLGVPRIMKVEMSWVEEVVPFFQQLTWMLSLLALDFGVAALDLGFLSLGHKLIFAYVATLPLLPVLAFAATELLLLMGMRCPAKRNLTRLKSAFSHACRRLTVIVWCPMLYTVVARLLHLWALIHVGVGMAIHMVWGTTIHVLGYMLIQAVRWRTGTCGTWS